MKYYSKKQIKEAIKYWSKILHKNTLVESVIPTDENTLRQNFHNNDSNEKYSPTVYFLMSAYSLLNELFFNKLLPENIDYKISSQASSHAIGYATYRLNLVNGTIKTIKITLNGTRKLSLHDWLEVVLHEMIHICDYETHAEHFIINIGNGINIQNKRYDAHGSWFLNYGKQFEKYGFNVKKYCDSPIEINTDNKSVKKMIDKSIFILIPRVLIDYEDGILRVSEKNKMTTLKFLSCRYPGKLVTIFKSTNPNITQLKETRMRNKYSSFTIYKYNTKLIQKFGPFEKIDKLYLGSSLLDEDKDELNIDDQNIINDEYARQMYDKIKGIIDIEKKNKNTYEISIA